MRHLRARIHALRSQAERGSTAVFTAVLIPSLLLMGTLSYDIADKANAGRQASLTAAEAARAAGQPLTNDALTGQIANVDTSRGIAAAQAYLTAAGVNGTVTVSGRTITVTTSLPWAPVINTWLPGTTLTGTATTTTSRA